MKKRIANNVSRGIATASEYKVIARNIAADSNVGFNRAMRIAGTEGHISCRCALLQRARWALDEAIAVKTQQTSPEITDTDIKAVYDYMSASS